MIDCACGHDHMTTAEVVAHTWECWSGCTIYEPDDDTAAAQSASPPFRSKFIIAVAMLTAAVPGIAYPCNPSRGQEWLSCPRRGN